MVAESLATLAQIPPMLIAGSVVINPLWFLRFCLYIARVVGRVSVADLEINTAPFARSLLALAVGGSQAASLSRRERLSAQVLLWLIRCGAFAGLLLVVASWHALV